MRKRNDFDLRTGRVQVPVASEIPRVFEDLRPRYPDLDLEARFTETCSLKPKQGCYKLQFRPKQGIRLDFLPDVYNGTLRFEEFGDELRISADLYKFKTTYPLKFYQLPKKYKKYWGIHTHGEQNSRFDFDFQQPEAFPAGPVQLPRRKQIPIYPRKNYHSFLNAVSARLAYQNFIGFPCEFSITFEQYFYEHPDTGFNGSFPTDPDRIVRLVLEDTDRDDFFEGKLFEDGIELGSIKLEWISSSFRKAKLIINQLEGAEMPQAVNAASGIGTEDFSSIFATAGWHLNVIRRESAVPLPESLEGVQGPDSCWNPNFDNMHELMESLPDYDSTELDSEWKAHLIAIPASLGCSRGWMFDSATAGDLNGIFREGAVTHSHDGYPSSDGVEYGIAEDELQKDHARSYLRSAAHEVGHTFNQIHQFFEGGSDNSIMTVTPNVAAFLDDDGGTFPDDISLAFNATVRRHLIHLPDPAVRPGAMAFFGSAVTAPQDAINYLKEEDLELDIQVKKRVQLGEPLPVSWTLTNRSKDSLPVPRLISTATEVAHLSITDAQGNIQHMKTLKMAGCSSNRISMLKPKASRKSEDLVFWSVNGFAFTKPGRHRLDLILLWEVDGLPLAVKKSINLWVDFPVTQADNEVAGLLFDDEVGRLISGGVTKARQLRYKQGMQRLHELIKKYPKHPVSKALQRMKLLD